MCINHNNNLVEKMQSDMKNYISAEILPQMPFKTTVINEKFKELQEKLLIE